MKSPAVAAADVSARSGGGRTGARRWGRNRYVQAAVMCGRRWTVRLAGLWLLVCVGLMSWAGYEQWAYHAPNRAWQKASLARHVISYKEGGAQGIILTALIALFVVPAFLAVVGHAREQVTDWRGTVMPGYRGPHLVAAAMVVVGAAVVVGGGLYALVPFSEVGLAGIVLGLAAFAGWVAALRQRGALVVAVGGMVMLAFPGVRVEIEAMLLRQDPVGAAVVLVGACVALTGAWVRLGWVREWPAAGRAGEELRLGTSIGPVRRRGGEGLGGMSLWRRVALWGVPSSSGWLPAACGVGLFALDVGLCFVGEDRRHGNGGAVSMPLAYLSVVVPVMAVGSQWSRRVMGLGYEMTRPVRRGAFVREMGLALAADWAAWWGWMTAGALAGVAFSWWWSPLDGEWVERVLPRVAYVAGVSLVASAAIQVVLYAGVAWVLRFQSRWGVYAAVVAGVVAGGWGLGMSRCIRTRGGGADGGVGGGGRGVGRSSIGGCVAEVGEGGCGVRGGRRDGEVGRWGEKNGGR